MSLPIQKKSKYFYANRFKYASLGLSGKDCIPGEGSKRRAKSPRDISEISVNLYKLYKTEFPEVSEDFQKPREDCSVSVSETDITMYIPYYHQNELSEISETFQKLSCISEASIMLAYSHAGLIYRKFPKESFQKCPLKLL